ncbi:DNA gyrase inhibitor YacG [Histidinibacterium lentulum]|uniref:DNA gyrase inhibitor YacG n=1 Tax=Histidinibacterium lentulum TaxID=2480588 RepID=A0A3N2QW97_9RHOB|nr:DNA gyrase inhibitor YacG [Histidinibacterium lentulum]ROT99503.1 DNA gyrase inhibitor YacG [Histidinibacterium lentulum]
MTCPICARPTVSDWRPFCSKRCADVDLAKWLGGAYRVPSEDPEDAEEALRAAGEATPRPH